MADLSHTPDAVIIAGDFPQEFLGKDVREKTRLMVDGVPASLGFLDELFRADGDSARALQAMTEAGPSFVSLNGPYLAQYLERRGFRCALIPLLSFFQQELAAALAQKPRAVVISTTFLPFAKHIDAIAAKVKQLAPGTTVIAGGVQVWKAYRHRQLMDEGRIDETIVPAVAEHNYFLDAARPSPVDFFIVSPSGEEALAEMLAVLPDRTRAGALPNVAAFKDGQWRINPIVAGPHHDICVDWSRIHHGPTRAYLPVLAGIGCHFRCAFCDFAGLRPVRTRDAESLVNEIRSMPSGPDGLRRVYFTDDNLFTSRNRAREILRALIDSGMPVRWRGLVRIGIVDEELAELMARSGCLDVLLGIESGDAEMLRRMDKRVTPAQILAGIDVLTRHGIHTKSTFLIGFPGETEASIQNTVDLLNAYPTNGGALHRYLFFTFAVLPLSAVATPESRAEYGLKGYGYHWEHSTMDSGEASARMQAVHEQIRDELTPNYVLEVPEVAGLDVSDLKQVCRARNALARLQRGGCEAIREAAPWCEIATPFVRRHAT